MKKHYFLLIATAAALIACSEEHFPDELSGGYGTILQASLPSNGFDSRVDIAMDGNKTMMAWSKNDAFAAFSKSGGSVPYCIVPEEAGKAEATFKAPLDIFIPEFAFFPSNFVQKLDGNVLTLKLPSTYGLDMNSQNSPMLGTVVENKIDFKHVSGIIRINFANLPEGYNTVKVVSSNDIAGTFKIENVNAGTLQIVPDYSANDHKKEVTIVHTAGNEPYYLPLPAGRYDELHVYAVGEKDYQLFDVTNEVVECGEMFNITKDYLVAASDEDFRTLRTNILKENQSAPGVSQIDNIMQSVNTADGSFNGISYEKAENGVWKASKHLDYMLDMASAYIDKNNTKYYASDDLHKAIEKTLNFWVTKKPEHWNWWNHQVEEGKKLGLILVKMKVGAKPLDSALLDKVLHLMIERCGNPFDKTGANRTDVAMHWLYRASATEDRDVLSVSYQSFLSALSYTVEEGFQHDGSFFQHGPQLYIGGYGEEILKATTQMASMLAGTSVVLPQDKLDLLSKFVRETYYGTVRGNHMSFSVMGRSVSRPGTLNKTSSLRFAGRMKTIDPAHAADYQNIISRINGAAPSMGVVASHKHFFNADYTLHVRPNYTFDVRMVSQHTCRVESGNNENLKGYFMADGSTNILVDGDEYSDIMPSWLWARLPGVTAPDITNVRIPRNPADWGVLGTSTFAGGVSDGFYGASAYSYYDNYNGINTGANKSWFFFDDEVVCMGKVNSSSADAVTTANQCLQDGEVIVDGVPMTGDKEYDSPKCVYHNKVGYVFPEGGNIWVINKSLRGNWKLINRNYSGVVTKKVFGVGFRHNAENKMSYSYVVVPGINAASELDKYTGDSNPIHIVANAEDIQSVYHKNLKIWQTVFFKPNQEIACGDMKLKADLRCIVMVEQQGDAFKVYVADPGRTGAVVNIDLTLPGNVEKHLTANFGSSKVYAGETKVLTVSK